MQKSAKFIGIAKNGEQLLSPEQAEAKRQFLLSLENKTVCDTITLYYPSKTQKQLATIFGLMIAETIMQANALGIDVTDFLKFLVNDKIPKGQGLTKDFLHELMYVICPIRNEDGKRVTLSNMNTKQAAQLFEQFRNIVAPLGIVIPDPNPNLNRGNKNE